MMDKPFEHINKIISSLLKLTDRSPGIRSFQMQMEQTLPFSDDEVFIIVEGKIGLCSKRSHLLLGNIHGPYILNIIPGIIHEAYTISRSSQFSYFTCKRNVFYAQVDEQKLWLDVLKILGNSSRMLNEQLDVMKFRSLYEAVKYYLMLIESSDVLKKNENICNYITSRTGYSKSGIMTILKELKKGSHIETSNGRLVWMKPLPIRF